MANESKKYTLYGCYMDVDAHKLLQMVEEQLRVSKDFAKQLRVYLYKVEKARPLTDEEKKFCEDAVNIHQKNVDAILMTQALLERCERVKL